MTTSSICAPIDDDRVQAPARVLEDHAHAAASHAGTRPLREVEQRHAVERDGSLDDRVLGQQAREGEQGDALARPALACQREDATRVDAQVDAVDREDIRQVPVPRRGSGPAGRGRRARGDVGVHGAVCAVAS